MSSKLYSRSFGVNPRIFKCFKISLLGASLNIAYELNVGLPVSGFQLILSL